MIGLLEEGRDDSTQLLLRVLLVELGEALDPLALNLLDVVLLDCAPQRISVLIEDEDEFRVGLLQVPAELDVHVARDGRSHDEGKPHEPVAHIERHDAPALLHTG